MGILFNFCLFLNNARLMEQHLFIFLEKCKCLFILLLFALYFVNELIKKTSHINLDTKLYTNHLLTKTF